MNQRIIVTNELVTGPAAVEMLRRSLKDTPSSLQVLDNACGGGVVTAELLQLAGAHPDKIETLQITAADIDPNMIDHVEARKARSQWKNVNLVKGDQQSLALPDSSFTHVFNNFGIFFCLNDKRALAETLRIMRPGGKAAFTTWKTIAWWESFAVPARAAHLPNAPLLPDPITIFPSRNWNDSDQIRVKMEAAGFQEVQVSEYSFTPDVPPEEFAEACAVLTKGMAKRLWSEKDFEAFADGIQPAYLKYLVENFPGGKWNGQMTAIISIGKKAG